MDPVFGVFKRDIDNAFVFLLKKQKPFSFYDVMSYW